MRTSAPGTPSRARIGDGRTALSHASREPDDHASREPDDLVGVFAARVAEHPDATAITCAERVVDYRELDESSDAVRRFLEARGADTHPVDDCEVCGPELADEAPVGVFMDRGVDVVAAMVGTVKAGRPYVPLDIRSPAARSRLILDECGIGLVLVDTAERASRVREFCAEWVDVVCFADAVAPPGPVASGPVAPPGSMAEAPARPRSPRRLAYVIHTSGSTGVPKGVEVEHRDLVAFAADPCWSDGLDRRVLQYSPLAFDASVFEIWMPLLRGGRVVVAPPGEVDAGVVARLIKEEGVTCAFVTTSLFNVMVEQDPAVFAGIGRVWMGGEAASPLAVSRALRAGGAGTVVNVYGPTEGTIFAAFHVPTEPVGAPVPIGSAMAGVRTYVLDERLDPVDTGADGELCLGGRGVARGYRGRPGITADRFVPDPFAGGGARMYRTGDIVRRRPDGLLEFVGRRDRQVKVRGFRIELGEIESRIALRPDVAGAAVLAVPDAHGDKTIVAYLVPRRDTSTGDANPRPGEPGWGRRVLGELAATLPAYMVPTDCVVLDALPLTPNGKVDSAALPAPTHAVDGRAPRSAVEELLCEVFADLLGLDRVGIDDNFIELGGHSLLATRAVARIAAAGAGLLRVVDVFEAPTPAALALRLDAAARARTAERPPPAPRPRPDVIPLSFAQRRLWLVNRLEGSANPDYHIPLLFRLHTEPDLEALRAALRDVIERHESLRTVFPVQHDDVPHQHILDIDEFGVRIPVTDCAADAVDAEITRAARAPFDLTTRPPIRAELIRTPHESLLLVVVHHISADGWSLTTLTRDLGRAYAARIRGTRPDIPPLPLQYRDYAAWQREHLGDENDPDSPLGRQLAYWTGRLADAPAGLTLPTDRPRPIVAGHAGDVHAFELPADLCTALDDLARSAHTTLFVALHAGLAGLLTRLGAGEDIVVGSPIAGRADAVLDDLIGFFVNTVVLRTDTSGDPTFAELLARVDRSWLPAYAHQEVPFDLLVEKLNPVRSLSRHPIFQVSLGLLNTPDAITGLPGLADPWTLANTRSAKFDLAFHLFPHRTETGRPDRIDATVEYATDLFDRDTVRRMADRLVRLLREAVADPHRPLGALTVLDDAELADLRPIAPATHPEHDTLIAAFHARVAAHPQASAVGEDVLTYRELAQRARALADGLNDVDAPVALLLEPGVDAVTATVGVIEAGGTYVPLDPGLPDRRLATILADSGAGTVLVDHPERAARVRALVGPETRVLPVADTIRAGAAAATGSAPVEIDPDRIACIAYTSDSTGALVGVCTSHRDLLTAPDHPGEPLLRASGPIDEDGPYPLWARLLRGVGVDTVREPDPPAAPIAGGPRARLMDETGTLVGIGMIGELCLAEPGIASGYLGRPALTAERFVPDPYGPPGSRMYRTGDLFHRRADGSADHVGRRDRQLRLGARRIEPAAIEAALTEHTGVTEAVVVRRDDEHLGEILVGYLVPAPGHTGLDDVLIAFLADRLPAHLVPAALVPLPALPRTASGTVDEAALPALDLADPSRPPRTAEERALCALYARTLDVPEVRLDDSFFELGGNSLAAIRLVGRLRADHSIEVPVKNVFRHPTPAAFLAGLPTEARLRLTGPDHDRDADEHTIPRTTTADDLAPLSFAQRRLWFLDQLWPNRPDYNLPVALRLTGPLDPDRLRTALTGLVARHDILRTRYVLRDDEAHQLVEPAAPIVPRELDLRTLPIEQALPAADAAIADDLGRPFDLAAAPPVRTLLVRLADDDHILFLVVHHIATDGWSSEVLCRELADRYRLGARYEPDPPALRYADYAAWESGAAAADPARRAQADYWGSHLAGLTSVELPGDRPRPPVMSGRGEQFDFEIPADLRRRLLDLSRTHESTPFITLLTAFQVLVARRTGVRDIAVGTPVAGRSRPELDGLIGLFVNTLVLRVDLDPALGFADLIARTRADAAAAYSHQDLPFEQLVDELRPERDLGRNPLFQLMFSMADVNPAPADWGELGVAPHPVPFRAAKLDLEIAVAERGDTYLGSVYYATDLFDPATIERLARDYVQLLAALVERPHAPVGGLGRQARLGAPDALGSAPDRAQALTSPATGDARHAAAGDPEAGAEPYARWNDTAVDHDLDQCLHDLFARQARRTPHTAAVIAGRETLDYAELDRRANRFAHRLVAHGVRPGLPVGLRLDRGSDLAVALLGILKAGGAYLPLDPDLPPARARQLLDEAGTDICVVDATAGDALPADAGIRTITVDSTAPDARSDTSPDARVDPDDLVSIYYTSGSTGKPKGVANPHRGWVNRMWWMHRRHGLAVGDRVLHKTVLSFDDSAVELFWPWLVGGTVVMLEPGLHRDPREILRAAVEHEVAVLQFVPSMLGLFLDELDAVGSVGLDRLRVVVSSGEALRPDLVARFRTHLDARGARLHNQWGPTEASIDATHHVCGPEDAKADTVPIGLPLDNYRVHVLDAHLRPVPVGVEGELHVGGPGLARGYWNDPRRTAEAFVPDPDVPGERLYRTGDRAIRRPDGELLFLGRVDHQVKIRGIRVELGEIEAMLVAHPDIADAVVTKWEPTPGDHRLLAYLVAAAGTRPEPEHVRAYLGERLPPYLVPTGLTLLDALPLSPNGKVDRKRLPAPDRDAQPAPSPGPIRAPETDAELLVAEVWAQFLDADDADANFFALGGHSLLATRIVSRLRRALDAELPLVLLFEHPTIAGFAAAIEAELLGEPTDGDMPAGGCDD
ncbi:amino acid adenylation domain-containing protein [Embleya sp. NPDC020630]|uniref:amino acid adenylation domain-containing protein n=1 Tax=Embleya sp. NPDC020630 TaxID=3363979 RepID=UPI00378975BF